MLWIKTKQKEPLASSRTKESWTVVVKTTSVAESDLVKKKMLCNNYQTSISLIGRSSLNCCLAHQPAATNSVLLQFTCTCLIGDTFGIQWNICDGAFLRKTLMSFGYFCRRAPSSIIDRILNATLSNNLTESH